MKTYIYHVSGTHCPSCKILIEDVLQEQDFVEKAIVDLKKETIQIQTESEKTSDEIAEILAGKIKPNGYTLSVEKIIIDKKSDDTIWTAIPVGLVIMMLFFLLQRSGILNFGIGGSTTPVTSFVVGFVASLSSCLAIVGGLVLSLSAKLTKDEKGSTKKPFVLFHLGRLFGFAFLGGLLGLIGKGIGINFTLSSILGLVASTVMIILGFNLLGIFKKNKITLPSNIFSFFRKVEHAVWAPVLIGLGTFFLPCGFTQSMQIAALSSGSFITGFSIMFSFALGTLPVLAFLSFGTVSFAHSKYAPLFFKTAGVVVVGLGIFALLAGLAGIGIINPLFSI